MRAAPQAIAASTQPTIWGLSPAELHDRFWAARGVQVVRAGVDVELVRDAELFLLLPSSLMVIFRLRPLVDDLSWVKPQLLRLRISDDRQREYMERAITDAHGMFVRYERRYRGGGRLARVALTPSRHVALAWQAAPTTRKGWARLREIVPRHARAVTNVAGRTADRDDDRQVAQFVRDMVQLWSQPDATIDRARRLSAGVWCDVTTRTGKLGRCIAPIWLGAGRDLNERDVAVGPAVLWDAPTARPVTAAIRWDELEPMPLFSGRADSKRDRPAGRLGKRAFDIVFSILVLLAIAPLLPIIMLAILIEDGRPFFFVHRRETLRGRPFPCLKFRSMRKDAERIKTELAVQNQVDGPQFHMADDPRVTRVGRFLRKHHLDELPQFVNVLLGHMSVVGPRPSPYEENQYCPPWREARLSVRPGITGLWQVMRTRKQGLDFQEWIRFDVEYVQNQSLALDLWIIGRTVVRLLQRKNQA